MDFEVDIRSLGFPHAPWLGQAIGPRAPMCPHGRCRNLSGNTRGRGRRRRKWWRTRRPFVRSWARIGTILGRVGGQECHPKALRTIALRSICCERSAPNESVRNETAANEHVVNERASNERAVNDRIENQSEGVAKENVANESAASESAANESAARHIAANENAGTKVLRAKTLRARAMRTRALRAKPVPTGVFRTTSLQTSALSTHASRPQGSHTMAPEWRRAASERRRYDTARPFEKAGVPLGNPDPPPGSQYSSRFPEILPDSPRFFQIPPDSSRFFHSSEKRPSVRGPQDLNEQ